MENLSRKKTFIVREEHLRTISVLEEAIEDYFAMLEWRMGGPFFLTPYWAKYRAIQAHCVAELKLLHARRRLVCPAHLRRHPILRGVLGVVETPATPKARSVTFL